MSHARDLAGDDACQFRRRLGYAMSARRMSTADVARASGLSYECIRRYQCGIHMPDSAALVKLCRALGTSADYLLGLV